jgi:hypothetical protein
MATIDPRLIPLIETLVNSGADWLAFEILDGIRLGRPQISPEEEVRAARDAVWSFRRGHAPPNLETREAAVAPLVGDDQIRFAEEYTINRIFQSIAMAENSLMQLNQIADQTVEAVAARGSRTKESVVLRWTDGEESLTRMQAEEMRDKLPALRNALVEWSKSVRNEGNEK